MASNLAGDICIGQHSACILRLAKLTADCRPLGGVDSGIVTRGIVTLTATPDIKEGQNLEPETGCGDIAFTVRKRDRVKGYNLAGEIIYHDWEMYEVLYGGTLILGRAGTDFAGQVIGWAEPDIDDPVNNGVYLEVIVQNAGAGVGDCAPAGNPFPEYTGHIFGKVEATPGEKTFDVNEQTLQLTGKAKSNPNLFDGPWNDYTGAGYIKRAPHQTTSYSADEFAAIEALAGCGYLTLPAGS